MNKQLNTLFPNPFWDYSLRIYGNAAVRDCCLMLQNLYRADVNMLLFLCWRAENGVPTTDKATLTAMIGATEALRSGLVEPLRALRRSLKTSLAAESTHTIEAMRDHLLTTELAAEAIVQSRLYQNFPIGNYEQPALDPEPGLAAYMQHIGHEPAIAHRQAGALDKVILASHIF